MKSRPRTHPVLAFIASLAFVATAASVSAAAPSDPPANPISGFFITLSTTDAANIQKLTDIKAVGGDTVIAFGNTLRPASLATVPADCLIGGVNCAQAAATGVAIGRIFTYSDGSHWGTVALKCPRDMSITSNGKLFTILVFAAQGGACNSPNGIYDVVVVSGGNPAAADAAVSMAAAATTLGMHFYAGMPDPIKRTDLNNLPDLSYLDTFNQFTIRFLQFQAAVNNVAGLAGFYHHMEMPLSDSTYFDPVLTLYTVQNQAIARILPTRAAVVSPYIDSRISSGGHITPAQAGNAARRIALTRSGIALYIAVQDGMGTSLGGSYFGDEAALPVDQYAAAYVGAGAWGSKYVAPNRDFYLAAAQGVAGTGATLWANMEGMAPPVGTNTCDTNTRGQTTKARIDRQLQQMANAPAKVISFMWDSYYTCTVNGQTLAQQIKAGNTTPVITDAFFNAATGAVQVTGFNLSGATVAVKWTDAAGQVRGATVAGSGYNAAYGQQQGLNPRLQTITALVGPTTVGPGKYYMVNVTNGWGQTNDAYFSKLG
ncbi:hypothetical protein ACQCSX_07435 [Pseudarthrobacter sp. P1]|uniref:hypothetical protein n=1 Tax=Pseudarthrobacter sp. P1 TaxID=3418418 RepID=UPI003CEAFB1B